MQHLFKSRFLVQLLAISGVWLFTNTVIWGQLIDRNLAPNPANEGIAKTFEQEIGAGRGDINLPDSSLFLIARDPFRSIRRGRQLFQRKFTRAQGQGPLFQDGTGNIAVNINIGAGLGDSCAICHGRPRGTAGFGGDVATRPDSRDTPHLFGLGLKEMLADEITADLRRIRDRAVFEAKLPQWTANKYYPAGAQCLFGGVAYEALVNHTAVYGKEPGRAHELWARPVPAGTEDWTPYTRYVTDSNVIYEDVLYECTREPGADNTVNPAALPSKWKNIGTAGSGTLPVINGKIVKRLVSKGIDYGLIIASPDGSVDTSKVKGVNPDLRVRPFFLHGGTISIREFIVGALQDEMGLQPFDPDLIRANAGLRIVTPSGMVLDGSKDAIELPQARAEYDDRDGDGVPNEIPASIVDHLEFYLLNYFKAATGEMTPAAAAGRRSFMSMGCTVCHKPELVINRDRRPADLETNFDPVRGISYNRLFGTAIPQFSERDDGSGFPTIKTPNFGKFTVRNIFTDFKRHDLGPNFWEINYDGTLRKEFLTMALWGVGSTAPYGHDGRSINLREVILRHGGEALAARNYFKHAGYTVQDNIIAFLQTFILFPPDDTPSTLDPGDVNTPNFPQFGHGSFRLVELFNNPADPE